MDGTETLAIFGTQDKDIKKKKALISNSNGIARVITSNFSCIITH